MGSTIGNPSNRIDNGSDNIQYNIIIYDITISNTMQHSVFCFTSMREVLRQSEFQCSGTNHKRRAFCALCRKFSENQHHAGRFCKGDTRGEGNIPTTGKASHPASTETTVPAGVCSRLRLGVAPGAGRGNRGRRGAPRASSAPAPEPALLE